MGPLNFTRVAGPVLRRLADSERTLGAGHPFTNGAREHLAALTGKPMRGNGK